MTGRTSRLGFGVAVFVAGAVLLGLEIAASRVLAPFFGSSLYVWGALIGVVLTGLSIGYWLGGAVADRVPSPLLMLGALGLGAAGVLAIPFVDDPVLEAIVRWDPGPRADPLVAAIVLFGPPSVVLATVSPIAVRLVTRSVTTLGRSAGRLFAISTAGSIAGTFATAFWLVPDYGTDQLLGFGAAALFAAATLFALAQRLVLPSLVGLAALAVAAVAAVALAPEAGGTLSGVEARNWSPLYRLQRERTASEPVASSDLKVVFRKESRYHRITVADDTESRYLRFDSSFQSGMMLGHPFRTRFRYTDCLDLGLAYEPSARDVLFIGPGGGSAPKRFWRDMPRLRIQVAELDPVVVDVARRYFALPRSPRLRVAVEDGRRYLDRHSERWDVIVIDAFYADSIPFHLTTREFLELVHERLRPGGVVVVNVVGALAGPDSRLFRSLARTYGSVFPTVVVHPVKEAGDTGDIDVRNLILVASDRPPPATSFLAERWQRMRRANPLLPDLGGAIRDRAPGVIRTDDVPLLADDYAPTDALLLD
ncbi:MAG TPA: fused MFS/spermidine synthase [Gaiellaceae bacterium]